MSELLVRIHIHHRSSRPLHVCSISSALTCTCRAERAHDSSRMHIVERSCSHWHLTQGKARIIVTIKWVVNILHIEWQQTKALIRNTPRVPALTDQQYS